MGWGRAILGVCSLAVAGCAGVPLPSPEQGFRSPQPYRHPAASTALAEREALFRAHRVRVTVPGFQVGAAPTGVEGLSAYWRASGAPDLADRADAAAGRVQRWQQASEASGLLGQQVQGHGQGVGGVLATGLFLGSTLLGAAADAEASTLTALALQYNARVLKALRLPLNPDALESGSLLPEPLGAARLELGLNASLEDRAWERSVHLWQGPVRSQWAWIRPSRASVLLIGGHPAQPGEIEAHLRHHGGDALADRYASGVRWGQVGWGVSIAASVVSVIGFTLFATGDPPYQSGPLSVGLGGLLALSLSPILIHHGTVTAHEAILEFDRALPGRLKLRLGAKF